MATNLQATVRRRPPPTHRLSLNDPVVRAVIYQIVVVGGVLLLAWYLIHNTLANLETRKIATGFAFLQREAGFAIGESLIEFAPADTYLKALIVGVLNTLRVAVVGIVLATILGTFLGIARLSRNWLLAKAASVYVEFMRNIPLLLQLFFWYVVITESLSGPREAVNLMPGVYLSNRGFRFPTPVDHPVFSYMFVALLLGVVASIFVSRWAKRRQEATGAQFPTISASIGLVLGLPLLVFLLAGAPLTMDWPTLRGFNFVGGASLTPEFVALLVGLVTYTAAFIAEIVRSGILAVSKGQWEAAGALGLRRSLILRNVVLPQAMRVIVPPMTSQYLNITKNSSLAVAIGYPDLVSIANTTLNQTWQAIEGIALIMAVYLTVSLSISAFMNWYNKHIALVER
ncbi:MAG: amino acid ABC transporter permease [Proteobacteria bacterium]|nr:amino acid ABC transporter permease [Pseudomonadota bacterium]